MDFTDINSTQMLAIVGLGAFVCGCLMGRLARSTSKKSASEDPRNHLIRELEADLRMTRRRNDELDQELESRSQEFETSVATLQELRGRLNELETEAAQLRDENRSSVAKMRELRMELQDRATQSVREHIRAEEAVTELQVARAGSDAVLGEINRLQEERERLSDTMRVLEQQVMLESDRSTASDRSNDND